MRNEIQPNSDQYYFVLENRISLRLGSSPIQSDKLNEINQYLINNFGPNFGLKLLSVNSPSRCISKCENNVAFK